jgi:glycine/D-amino acid oxidase-like deaminating enzyme/ferredoxin/bacterioferritin-associated ferredoxin
MSMIREHPILDIPDHAESVFRFGEHEVRGQVGFTIAAALHQAGFPVHSHSLKDRERSLVCGIGKCGACEMLVDGEVRRICITKVDGVREVREIPKDYRPAVVPHLKENPTRVYRTRVAVIGAGPAGLAVREELRRLGIATLVLDNNEQAGGQFVMQTHQFFFFEREKKFGGMRGFDIARTLAEGAADGIMTDCLVWDVLEGRRLAVKRISSGEVFYVDAEHLVVATGAVPFLPAFENDDIPGVYTAAVVQKMMNSEFTLLGKNVLTVGAGNIGYLVSYQLVQAGATVKAILEAQPREGGFPVQANRVRRLGIPILTSKILLKAIPNADKTGVSGAVIADCRDFQPVPGTEQVLSGIDMINICTGLVPDNQLLLKGQAVFGRRCHGAGDAVRIGEGTSAVLRGRQAAQEIAMDLGVKTDYNEFLQVSKEYIDSQQHPIRVLEAPALPAPPRLAAKGFAIIDCLYGFACNPCAFACPHGAISKSSTSTVPQIDFDRCVGCMECVYQCPGLAIIGVDARRGLLHFPLEYPVPEGAEVFLVDNLGAVLGEGRLEKILRKPGRAHLARVQSRDLQGEALATVRGFIPKDRYPGPLELAPSTESLDRKPYICHCEDVEESEILDAVGDRRFISVDELKHAVRLGMGPCRGKRCLPRARQLLKSHGIELVGDPVPRGPLSSPLTLGETCPAPGREIVIPSAKPRVVEVGALVAGGGIAGSSVFRYLAEAGLKPVLANHGHGSSWRNIAGGRPVFSVPEISDIATHNLEIFEELHRLSDIALRPIHYISFAHDVASLQALEASRAWSDSYLIGPDRFREEIAPTFNTALKTYQAALVTRGCWQAAPGKTIDLVRRLGMAKGGTVLEDARLIDVMKDGDSYCALVQSHDGSYTQFRTPVFINALGSDAERFARKLGIDTGVYPVRHQAFITRRLPMLGRQGNSLDMLIDRRHYKGFSAVYGQQLHDTGQIIGCASPACDPADTNRDLRANTREFIEIVSEVFTAWLPELSSVGFQAVWSGYYTEPKYIVDPGLGLFIGLRGQGFMLGQYLGKLYVDKLMGRPVPDYFSRLQLSGDGLCESAFK